MVEFANTHQSDVDHDLNATGRKLITKKFINI